MRYTFHLASAIKLHCMKTHNILILTIIATLITSCNKQEIEEVKTDGRSDCIIELINDIKSEAVRNPPGSIWQYEYNGLTVYYIPPYCCDYPSELYDSACNLICSPDGGATGNGDGNCEDFFIRRKNEKLIWQDSRK
jgi:hypothetical protein